MSQRTMLTALLLTTLLNAAPQAHTPAKVTVRLAAGSLMGCAWFVPTYQRHVESVRDQALGALRGTQSEPDVERLAMGAPMLGPWMMLAKSGFASNQDAPLLLISGGLQALGLATLTYRLLTAGREPAASESDGIELSFSPVAAGRLGLSMSLTGW